ncbi:efflux RND transporter permease subunit [Bradyrhizobium erythrophlei]|uniref:Multidrug efflux pump subunit AcrB n=1 Tax=Bradyrhizobium erythrophlei TaxID=1437360 RepID=A0A1M5KZV9_9BRAD|nr:efflux RND transporter permease subunit [Bradyrhizobium erythrophlei]SHG58402.1 Multidrug efflux pump subunit AcrB [Bradyrhizobium erythrophlei]
MWIVQVALKRPYTFIVLAFLIAIFGSLAAVRTPTDIFPSINIPVVSVVWTYSGLLPKDMSDRVIYYYERQLTSQVNGIQHVESQSLSGYGVVKIFFQKGVDIGAALAQVTAVSQTVLKLLPAGITPPYVLSYNASSVPILNLALSSKKLPQDKLFDLGQNFIRPQLATVNGAALPSPYGGKILQAQVDLDQRAMQTHKVSADDVVNAISAQNLVLPAGTEKIGKFEWNVDLNASPTLLDHINDLPLKKVDGTVIHIRDVAYAHDGSPPQTNIVRVNGARAVLMSILNAGSASTLDIIAGIKARLPRIEGGLPSGLDLKMVGDQSPFIRSAISGVVREGVIAAALTGLMILLFLGSWRLTIIVLITIPLAILFSLTALSWLGETINTMTLGGLALAVGILVDESTVTLENMNWHLEQGKALEPAILDGAQQIVIPAFVTLVCMCIVFAPMFQLGGVAGYLFMPLAEAVIFALIGSFLLSRTLVPTLAKYLMRAPHPAHGAADDRGGPVAPSRNPLKRFQLGFEHRFEQIRDAYHRLLSRALGRPKLFAAGFLAFVVPSFALVPFLGQNFFPSVDAGQILIHVRAQAGTRIEETARLCDQVDQEIRRTIPPNQLASVVTNIGLPISGINVAYNNTGTIGPSDADIMISLHENHAPTAGYVKQLRALLPQKFPGTTFAFLPADIVAQILNFGLPAPIDLQVIGNKQEANYAYATDLLKRIRKVPGIADLRIQQTYSYPQINVAVDRTLADEVGLSQRDVADSLLVTLSGSGQVKPNFWLNTKNGVSYPIVAQTPQYRIDTMSDLANVPITSQKSGTPQYLGGLADFSIGPSAGVVSHYDAQPVIDVYGATQGRDLGAVASDIRRIIAETKKDVPAGSYVALRGQVQTMTSAYDQLYLGLLSAIVLVYLVIAVNFQSWLDPLIIISALPGALAGIVWMLFMTETTLSVPALTGALMCMGIATANSVLIVSFAREKLEEGLDATAAALEAGFTRFRPVMMTALAMLIGMMPMAFAMGDGGEQNAPLGRAVIGGLLIATLATLFFVPTVFSLLHRRHSRAPEGRPGFDEIAEPVT